MKLAEKLVRLMNMGELDPKDLAHELLAIVSEKKLQQMVDEVEDIQDLVLEFDWDEEV